MDESLFREAPLRQAPLRIGLLVDSLTALPPVFRAVTEHIRRCNFATLELLVCNDSSDSQVRPPASSKVIRLLTDTTYRARVLYSYYRQWDLRRSGLEDLQMPVPCEDLFAGVPVIRVKPIAKRFVHRFPPEAVREIQAHSIDVFFRFGFNILRGDVLRSARYGIWSFHHGDNEFYRGGPPGFWEMVEQNPLTGVILQVLTEELDAGHVLAKGIFATQPGLSLAWNRLQPYWGSVTFPIQKLRELYEFGWEHVERRSVPATPYRGRRQIYRTPSASELTFWLTSNLARKLTRRLTRSLTTGATRDHWRLAVRRSGPLIVASAKPDLSGFREISSPRGRFYADPFLMEHAGEPWVFFEDFNYAERRGRIAAARVDGLDLGSVVPVLDLPYHLSYPYLIRDGSELFMIPESLNNNSVDLYRCERFPDRWVKVRTLFSGAAVDTSVVRHGDRYWFFTTLVERRGHGIQSWLFHAPRIDGDWLRHRESPLSTDVRHSRSGGAILEFGDKLFRVTQDCSGHYGRAFRLNEIVALNPDRYEERPGVPAEPHGNPSWVGTHTYARLGDLEIIDTCTRMPERQVL